MSDSLQPFAPQPAWFLCPWDSPGKNTGVGGHFLLQGIFLTQGLNLRLLQFLHCTMSHEEALTHTHTHTRTHVKSKAKYN